MSFFDKLRSALDFADAQRMKNRPFCSVIVPAAGNSSRMNGQDKLFEDLCGMPVLARTLKAVNDCEYVDEIVIPTRPDCIGRIAAMMSAYALDKITRIIPGGESRTESVRIALSECSRDAGLIAIHDGARPLASTELIGHCIRSAMQTRPSAVSGMPFSSLCRSRIRSRSSPATMSPTPRRARRCTPRRRRRSSTRRF